MPTATSLMATVSLRQLGLAFQQDEPARPRKLPVFRDWDLEELTELEAEAQGYLGAGRLGSLEA